MQLILDRSLVDRIVDTWNDSSKVDARVYGHPVFQALHAHAQDFRQEMISPEAYLDGLLHIGGVDMRQYREEILRNLGRIEGVDLQEICKETEPFLPPDAVKAIGTVRIVPCIGVAGLALRDCIVMDPSPCPWFPDGVTDPGAYIERYVKATMRHELHHIGYARIRTSPPMEKIRNLRDLGGISPCRSKWRVGP